MFLTYRFRIHRNYTIVAKVIKVATATFIAGKHRDLGSMFSHETALAGFWRPCSYIYSIFNVY